MILRYLLSKVPQNILSRPYAPSKPTQWITQQWARAMARLGPAPSAIGRGKAAARPLQPFVLILDEVQKVPRWSEAVKALWDQRRNDKSGAGCLP